MVEWTELLGQLRIRKVDPIFLRLIISMYKNQLCDVKWGSEHSSKFPVKNCVRQGAVSSPIDDLIIQLRQSGLGCAVGNIFMGCFGYADDLLLLSASRSGLQAMVNTCQEFASLKNLTFSTNPDPEKSKTKCLVFSKKQQDRLNVAPINLNGDPLPWVTSVKHLGNILECSNTMKQDCSVKRGKFVGKINNLDRSTLPIEKPE